MKSIKVTPSKSLVEICKKAIENLGFEFIDIDSKSNVITANTGLQWFSWGKSIEIKLKNNPQKTSISVKVHSKLSIELDFGGNKKIEESLIKEIEKLIKQ